MDNDAFLNGFGWVLPVSSGRQLVSFGYSLPPRGPPEGFAWRGHLRIVADGAGGLVITLVLELSLSEDLATAREVAFWVLIPALLWARSKHRALVGER